MTGARVKITHVSGTEYDSGQLTHTTKSLFFFLHEELNPGLCTNFNDYNSFITKIPRLHLMNLIGWD
jgi:hypothetical protein